MLMKSKVVVTLFVLALVASGTFAQSLPAQAGPGGQAGADVDIPFQKFVLANGLTLLLHEDHQAPIVAVNLWYHVGSKNEKPG